MTTCSTGVRRACGVVLVATIAAPTPVSAQGTFQLRPFVSVAEVYESNLFSTPAGQQEDFITRVTPGVESDYRSPLWTFSARYALDLERFASHRELTAMDARQQAGVAIAYRPAPRVSLSAGAEYLSTRTPGELNVATGLTFTRARAERFSVRSLVTRQLSPVTAGTLEYAFASDRLSGGVEAGTHTAAASVGRRLSPRTAVTGRYRAHHFTFAGPGVASSFVSSHSLGLAVTHAITSDLSVSIDAGPRLTGDRVLPEVSTSVSWNDEPVDLSLAYGRTQSTAIGLVGAVDTQSLQMTVARAFGRSVEVRVTPAVFRSALAGLHADVYLLGIGLIHRFSSGLALDVAVDGAVQQGSLFAAASGEPIPRHSVVVRFVAGPPERAR